jgi:DNA-binding NarL/FixJ family response regulator
MGKPLKLLIADDHPMVRLALRQWLQTEFNPQRIVEVGSGQAVLDALDIEPFDLLILDLNMPNRSGLDILKIACVSRPELPVLVVSCYSERQYSLKAIQAGAAGYVEKNAPAGELTRAIKVVLSGRQYVSESVMQGVLAGLSGARAPALHETLTEREFQVFCKLVLDRPVPDIAGEMFLNPRTVAHHRVEILRKLRVSSDADMTAYARRNHLLPN